MRSRWFVADALLLWAGEWGSHRVLTGLRLDQGVETTRTEVVEMLLWEDMQATPAFAKRLQRFRQAHPAMRRRV